MAPYARLEIILILLIGAAVSIATGLLFHMWWLPPALVSLALLMFYRDPPRRIVAGDDLLLSPADGKIIRIDREYRREERDAPQMRIVIFLSVFNVHINRAPCAGRVLDVQRNPGKFLNALKPEATTQNENVLIKIDPSPPLPGPVYVRPIAGVLAKRIVCVLNPGDEVTAGQRFGMIKLGSQTEILVPESEGWQIEIKPGQPVRAGLTILARYKSARASRTVATDKL
jgi:phosphatidylserine decarboxylase